MAHFVVELHEISSSFTANMGANSDTFNAEFGVISVLPSTEAYPGPYEVTPKVNAQTLATAQKNMKYDMQIKAIPYFDVGNASGGSTVYIGSEV
jgi:hypothetical protein